MSLPVCTVVCVMHDQTGEPVPGAIFECLLNATEVYEGYVVPARVTGTAGTDGIAQIDLWPNQLGSVESAYTVKMRNPQTGKSLTVTAVVPNQAAANLHDIAVLPPYPGKIDGQVNVEAAIAAGQQAQTAAQAADASAVNAAASAAAALASQTAAATSETNAAASATSAATQATTATTKAGEASASAAAALASQNAAATSETNAAASASAAAASEATATTQAGIATTGAGTATTKAAEASASAAAAAASEAAADTDATAAAASAASAASSAADADADRIAAEAAKVAAEAAAADAANKVDKSSGPQVMTVDLTVPSLNGGPFGPGNVLINATGQIAQEALGSRTDDTYAEDGWIVLTQTAAVTASTVTGAEDGTPFMMRLLQAQATPQRMGRLQIIESSRSKPFRGQTVTARFGRVRCSAAETVRYALLAWTGTADVVTSDVVNNWASATYTPGNFFLASNLTVIATGSHALAANTLTDGVSLTGVVPSGCNNLILFSWTDAAVAQNVTLDLAKARINHGSVATPYKHEDDAEVLLACSRFKVPMDNRRPMGQAISASAVTCVSVVVPVPMFVLPSISASSHSFTGSAGTGIAGFTVSVTNMVLNSVRLDASGGSGLVAGNTTVMVPAANTWLLAQL